VDARKIPTESHATLTKPRETSTEARETSTKGHENLSKGPARDCETLSNGRKTSKKVWKHQPKTGKSEPNPRINQYFQ
jgi:hypothetical protein